jgi:hypothetical protein
MDYEDVEEAFQHGTEVGYQDGFSAGYAEAEDYYMGEGSYDDGYTDGYNEAKRFSPVGPHDLELALEECFRVTRLMKDREPTISELVKVVIG